MFLVLSFGRSLTRPTDATLRLSFKRNQRERLSLSRQRGAYGGMTPKRQAAHERGMTSIALTQ
jgi:hypothetical protein